MEFLHLEIIEKTTPLQSSLVMNILPKRNVIRTFSTNIYLFKVSNGNTIQRYQMKNVRG